MHILQTLSVLLLTGVTFAANGPCSIDGTPGVCIQTTSCSASGGKYQSGFCPNDPKNVKCCIKPSCGSGGNCRFASQCSGTTRTGLCPGPADFKCCLPGSGGGSGGGSGTHHDISSNGVQFIAGFEGFRANFYRDSAGVKTIGYGHACQPSSACNSISAPISKATGRQLLKSDAERFVSCVNSAVHVALNQNQFDALVSFAFNLGCGNLREIAVYLNKHEFSAATNHMKQYVHAGGKVLQGLVTRRNKEVALFNS